MIDTLIGVRPRRRLLHATVWLLLVLLATACGEEGSSDTRRFANERPPTLAPSTATAASVAPKTPIPQPPQVRSPGALLATRGAPERLYFADDTKLWAIGANGDAPRALLDLDAEQGEIRSIAQAPGVAGDKVATLIVREDDGRETARLIFLNGAGEVVRRIDRLEAVFGEDTKVEPIATSVTWSPQGDLLLVTFAEGGIVDIPIDGVPKVIVPGDAASNFDQAVWSPAGDAIAFVATVATESEPVTRQLIVAPVVDGAVDPAAFMVASRAGDSVSAFSWLPDGSGLAYAESGDIGGTAGGDLFTVQSDGSEPRLIASAGRAAPVAQIVDFAVSPDGTSLAYTIATPDSTGDRLMFHSLWIRALEGTETVSVPIPANVAVTQLWWTDQGLVWRSQPAGTNEENAEAGGAFAIERLDPQNRQHVLFTANPTATPVASPGATPESIGATPESFDATPASSDSTPELEASPVAGDARSNHRG